MFKAAIFALAVTAAGHAYAEVYQCQAFEVDAQGNNNGIGNFSVDTRAEQLQWVSAGQDVVAACSGAAQQSSGEYVLGCGFLQQVYDTARLKYMNPLVPSNEDDYEWVSVSITLETAGALYQRTKVGDRLLGMVCSSR